MTESKTVRDAIKLANQLLALDDASGEGLLIWKLVNSHEKLKNELITCRDFLKDPGIFEGDTAKRIEAINAVLGEDRE